MTDHDSQDSDARGLSPEEARQDPQRALDEAEQRILGEREPEDRDRDDEEPTPAGDDENTGVDAEPAD
ncbi:hypothetical protein [Pseudonocardia phyllosphaerae]|uniref:hypothetical protein n=1 Tax=Pseudonocardia phyllosphaerae TaxID=3390502 RepID=UPI00397E6674